MSFTDVEFFYFAPLVFLLHWLLPRRAAIQNLYLVVASALFYAASNWQLYGLLFAGATIDFFLMRYMRTLPKEPAFQAKRRVALITSLGCSLGALAYFKYCGFFVTSTLHLLSLLGIGSATSPAIHVLLPLGISFYTLQRVGCVLDVYWERATAPDSFITFLLFASFFPQLGAGPISRNNELLPQLSRPRRLLVDDIAEGSGAFLLGYCLKAMIAEHIGSVWVDPVFAASAGFSRLSHVLAVVGYALQVFGDFAGYSLMAIGVAKLFGITLPTNFNLPFLSRSLPELWRRWHITLNRWLFDYIFTPLTTSQGWFRSRLDMALLVTFLASGLWHGAAWTFVAWGLMHGIGMVIQRNWDERYRQLCRKDRKYVALRKSSTYALLSWAATVSFFVASLIPFRAPTGGAAARFVGELVFTPGSTTLPIRGLTLFCVGFVIVYHLLDLKGLQRVRDAFFKLPAPFRGAIYGLVVVFLLLKVPTGSGTFIYQQF